jgi:predicted phage-related endonuclease
MSELSVMQSNAQIDVTVEDLRNLRRYIKKLEKQEEKLIQKIVNHMKDHEVLVNLDGEELVTYQYTSDVKFFDAKKLQSEHRDIYDKYMGLRPGSRRFVIK